MRPLNGKAEVVAATNGKAEVLAAPNGDQPVGWERFSAGRHAGVTPVAERHGGVTLEAPAHVLRSTTVAVSRLQPYAAPVFADMSGLAARIGAVDLGIGFPDEDGPPAMLKAAQDAIAEGLNQYPPGMGIASLQQAIAGISAPSMTRTARYW